MQIRTDLAIEARELYFEAALEAGTEIPGILCEEAGDDAVHVVRVRVENEEGAKAIGKQEGNYVTIEVPTLLQSEPSLLEKATRVLAEELRKMAGERKLTLVAGLGNEQITPDSLGPKVVPLLVVTRHLYTHMPQSVEHLSPVCALAPGVLGITGMETGEIIKGVAERVKPDLIIVVDALASRRAERVCTTIQLTDTGISPGSGVGNSRKAIDKETIGVPVIAIGVPMVVDAATIANDTIDLVIDTLTKSSDGDFYKMLKELDREEKHTLIRESLPAEMENMIVTPKDVDALSDKISHIVANGINYCLHPDITPEEITAFVS